MVCVVVEAWWANMFLTDGLPLCQDLLVARPRVLYLCNCTLYLLWRSLGFRFQGLHFCVGHLRGKPAVPLRQDYFEFYISYGVL